MKRSATLIAFIGFAIIACNNPKKNDSESAENSGAIPQPAVMNYSIIKTYPHDTTSFTEGLFLLNDKLYESTGLEKKSYVLKADIATGKAIQKIKLPDEYFGEGISTLNNRIYQLTWRNHKVFVYDMNFKKLPQEFEWPFEGWGMTTDGKQLIISTGGSNIYFVNPETFKIERTLNVMNNNGFVDSINELEYIDGYVYANVWQSDYIIKINLKTGIVEARADLSDIFRKAGLPAEPKDNVLNGIAYNPQKKSFYVTGKNWHTLFEVKFN